VTAVTLDELRGGRRATITATETFGLIGVSKNLGWKALHAGEIPGVLKVGSTYRVSVPALLAWLEDGPAPPEQGERPGGHPTSHVPQHAVAEKT
jgi:hypothetical protein